MRINRIDLTRFGCFTGHSINFGDRDPQRPDLHVVYGPNESGKSTLFVAILDLLFGIEKRSAYDFLHDYQSMRIGGLLEAAGQKQELVRIKKASNSLLGPDGLPLPEMILTHALGPIDRTSYRTMFSLDDDSLEHGGDSILQSEGDLGRLLFAAASGLSDISAQLDDINGIIAGIHRGRASTTEIGQLKSQLSEARRRQKELDLSAGRYAELIGKRDTAKGTLAAARAELDQAKIDLMSLQHLIDAFPMWDDLVALRLRMEPLIDLPDAPSGWLVEAQELSRKEASSKTATKTAEEDLSRLADELKGIVIDEKILALQDRIGRLKEEESRYRTAIDIPALEGDLRAVESRIASHIDRLGRSGTENPSELLLPVGSVAALNKQIEQRSGLLSRRDGAQRERDVANTRVREAEQSVEGMGAPIDVKELDRLLEWARRGDTGAQIDLLRKQLLTQEGDIGDLMLGLKPWQGDPDSLAMLSIPECGRIETWKKGREAARLEISKLSQRESELAEQRDRRTAEMVKVKQSSGVADDEEALAARAIRDQAWDAHRTSLGNPSGSDGLLDGEALRTTASAFEVAMTEDDRLVELRARQSDEIGRLRHGAEELAQISASLVHFQKQLEELRAREDALDSEIGKVLEAIGLPGDMELADLERWLERRERVLKMRADVRVTRTDLESAASVQSEARKKLGQALAATDATPVEDMSLSQMIVAAQSIVNEAKARAEAVAANNKVLEKARRNLDLDREPELKAADAALEEWQEDWSSVIAGCWLGEGGASRSSDEVREILKELSDLPVLMKERDDFGRRIQSMRRDQGRFVKSVRDLAADAGVEFAEERPLEILDELRGQLAATLEEKGLVKSKQADLERAETLHRGAAGALAGIESRLSEMSELYSVESVPKLLKGLAQAEEKTSLLDQIRRREQDLARALKQPSISIAEQVLEESRKNDVTLQQRDAESVSLAGRVQDLESQVTELHVALRSAESAIADVGGDDEVARLEEKQGTILLDIQEKSERYLRLKVGVEAAEQALRIYRDRHRSSMMKRSGEAFRTITRGRYQDLTTTPGKSGDILVGTQSRGASLVASAMSKGTRFQLYLALRVAGYHEFAERGETLPFIADDIMETFDDDRTAEAFRLLSSMAKQGQVIYLTHHAHVRDIARGVCGDDAQCHELPGPDSAE